MELSFQNLAAVLSERDCFSAMDICLESYLLLEILIKIRSSWGLRIVMYYFTSVNRWLVGFKDSRESARLLSWGRGAVSTWPQKGWAETTWVKRELRSKSIFFLDSQTQGCVNICFKNKKGISDTRYSLRLTRSVTAFHVKHTRHSKLKISNELQGGMVPDV